MILQYIIVLLLLSPTCIDTSCRYYTQRACPPPWLAFRDNCYLHVIEKKTFVDAEQFCSTFSKPGRPAHLVSIADSEENDFILQYAMAVNKRNFWIGYNDIEFEGIYVWMDGSMAGFEQWAAGEPSFTGRYVQDCTQMYTNGRWDDFGCTGKRSFMCKIKIYNPAAKLSV